MGDESTCWTVIHGAAAGRADARSHFAQTYLPVVRAYLGSRWRGSHHLQRLEDAVQDVFIDCFRENGALARADEGRGLPFRAFLHGVVRNVALRYEERAGRNREGEMGSRIDPDGIAAEQEGLSRVFDRAWARTLLGRAAVRQAQEARAAGPDAVRRVEILRLRFVEGLPIREMAQRWSLDAAILHREYAKAREEFKRALEAEVAFHDPGGGRRVEKEVEELLRLLNDGG